MLTSDSEKAIRMEISYHIRFIVKEFDELIVKKNFSKIFDNYLNDNDIIVKTEFIISALFNINKLSDADLLNPVINKIQNLFEGDYFFSITETFPSIVKVFRVIIEQISKFFIFQKNFINCIKYYIKRFFIVYEKDKDNTFFNQQNYPYDYLIEDFNNISKILKSNNENNFCIDFFNYLIKQIFDQGNNLVQNTSSTSLNITKIGPSDYKSIFFENLDKVKIIYI